MSYYTPSNQASQYVLYGGASTTKKTIQTVAADEILGTVVLPAALYGTVKAAFLDVEFYLHNKAAATQYFDGAQNIEANDGSTPINAYVISSAEETMLSTEATADSLRRCYLNGNVDISSIAVGGATITVTWKNAKSKASDLDLYAVRCSIRFITG